jgi:AcrR family transcriptional regulator
MPRPARFTDDDVLDAALVRVVHDGQHASIADVAAALGGPVGSIYHRFASREVLLVRLWLRSVARFQAGLFDITDKAATEGMSADQTLVTMALHIPRYCRSHPEEARALTLFRQDRLLKSCPEELRTAVADTNVEVEALTRRLVRERFGTATRRAMTLTVLATRVCPYGLVRPYLGSQIPAVVDDSVAAASHSILALGDD